MMYRNLTITMLAGGLWHGPARTFVVWGGLRGAGQVVQHDYRQHLADKLPNGTVLAWFLTLQFVCICWILFRATSFEAAMVTITQYSWLSPSGEAQLPRRLVLFGPALLLAQSALARYTTIDWVNSLHPQPFSFAYGALWAVAIALLPFGFHPFIYFQF